MNFTNSHITYEVTDSREPVGFLAAEYARCGWTHMIAARRPNGRKVTMFHARIEGGQVVATSTGF